MTQVHLNLPSLTIHWDGEHGVVWMEWKAVVLGEEFPAGMQKGLELLKQKAAQRWLVDLRKLNVLDVSDVAWSYEEWAHRARVAGLRRMAVIQPMRPVALVPRLSLADLVSSASKVAMEVQFFEGLDEAQAWLRRPVAEVGFQESRPRPSSA